MVELDNNQVQKKNNLNTKMIPPILMLIAGVISFVICSHSYSKPRLCSFSLLIPCFVSGATSNFLFSTAKETPNKRSVALIYHILRKRL